MAYPPDETITDLGSNRVKISLRIDGRVKKDTIRKRFDAEMFSVTCTAQDERTYLYENRDFNSTTHSIIGETEVDSRSEADYLVTKLRPRN